ncbi:AraC family transcriptional regulator [Roseibium polysiphoniae]|uniref:AraC family transcriptional regulator n=1 Tax=Roseibium polysiphoniae TaxID=2571221 RepID=A0ABR9C8T8_9HYPH|nr:AraC family transcriptional regulator [Roseibium polysiphoniae]MBD8876324.1 AraC family transcriptional regulator [Roseibium polysiphoniae]
MPIEDLVRDVQDYGDRRCIGEDPLATEVAGLSVAMRRRATDIYPVLYQPIFCLVLQGVKQTWLGDQAVDFGPQQSLVVGLDLPTHARVLKADASRPYIALALEVDMALVHELLTEIEPHGRAGQPSGAIGVAEADAEVVDAMGRLFRLTGKPDAAPVLSPLIRKEIHFWLLKARHGQILRQLAERDSHASRIALAARLIRRSYASSLSIEDLAGEAGMSVSAFHAHFKAVTGSTPLNYQKQLRLMEARRLIAAERLSVASAAFQVGYESASQFSREYSRYFGHSPRQDMGAGVLSVAG